MPTNDLQNLNLPVNAQGLYMLLEYFRHESHVAQTPAMYAATPTRESRQAWYMFAVSATETANNDLDGQPIYANGELRTSDVELAFFPGSRRRYDRLDAILRTHGTRRAR